MNLSEIKELVHRSPIFSDQEKAEWLGLVESMNSKQLSDLVDILQSQTVSESETASQPEIQSDYYQNSEANSINEVKNSYPETVAESSNSEISSFSQNSPAVTEAKSFPSEILKAETVKKESQINSLISKLSFFKNKTASVPANVAPKQQNTIPREDGAAPTQGQAKSPEKVIPSSVTAEALQNYISKPISPPRPLANQNDNNIQAPKNLSPFPESYSSLEPKVRRIPITEITLPPVPRPEDGLPHQPPLAVAQKAEANNAFEPPLESSQPGAGLQNGLAILAINNLSDIDKINVAVLRSFGPQKIVDQLQKMVRNNNYFDVLFKFEKSFLYEAYVYMGKKMLETGLPYEQIADQLKNEGREVLTKQEFEAVVDIQRQIRVN